ncbi:FAD:protein FMN transferase [Arenibacter certesii]|uniref:FAD:protein FMN transferase n=2 Tax=Arenibacter certesii TaxID=228955 RepID=A0A918IQN0_9FLAO|nr:FAD:protein FMN transferase [Arenibacter certesii]
MGSKFDITVVADNEEMGYINIEEAISEIERIDKMLYAGDQNSETHLINSNAGIKPVKVSYEMFRLIERTIEISKLTNGAFDISQEGMDVVWDFKSNVDNESIKDELSLSLTNVGYQNIVLNAKDLTVFLKKKGVKIGFGAIAKGYAVDKAKELLVRKQVLGGAINGAGDFTTWGVKANGEKWMIGIANPVGFAKMFSWIPVLESSVSTTESCNDFVPLENTRFSSVLDPRTGYPAVGVNRVSVFSKSAELCDALSTAVFVLGVERGLAIISQLDGTEVIIVDNNNVMHKTEGILLD